MPRVRRTRRQQVGRVDPPVQGHVGDDGVEALVAGLAEPAATVVEDDRDLGVREQTAHDRVAAHDLEIARVDFDDDELLDGRQMGDHLCPRAGAEADHEYAARCRMQGTDGVGAVDQVGVLVEADVEPAVVGAGAEDGAARGDRDHARARLDDVRKRIVARLGHLPQQALVERTVERRAEEQKRRRGDDDAHRETARGAETGAVQQGDGEHRGDARGAPRSWPPCRAHRAGRSR